MGLFSILAKIKKPKAVNLSEEIKQSVKQFNRDLRSSQAKYQTHQNAAQKDIKQDSKITDHKIEL